jgi:protoheme IX farnesyltransferase
MADFWVQAGRYIQLTKPKVTLLNLLVGLTCFFLAAYPNLNVVALGVFALVGYLAAGGCGVLNSVYDKDIDKKMQRTAKRSIPAGYITVRNGTIFGSILIALSFAIGLFYFNRLTLLMLGLGVVFYLVIYTLWLKRSSPWNVVIGGFAGCFAGLSGWTAAAGTLSLLPLFIALLDFLWTPGHLWGLAMKKVEEYRQVGVPMLPVTVGLHKASRIVFFMNALTVAFSLFPLALLAGPIYLTVALLIGSAFIIQNVGLLVSCSEMDGFKVFLASMPYLFCLMLALIVDRIIFL